TLFYLEPRGHGPYIRELGSSPRGNLGDSQYTESLSRGNVRGLRRSRYVHLPLVDFTEIDQHDTKADVHLEKNFNAISFCEIPFNLSTYQKRNPKNTPTPPQQPTRTSTKTV